MLLMTLASSCSPAPASRYQSLRVSLKMTIPLDAPHTDAFKDSVHLAQFQPRTLDLDALCVPIRSNEQAVPATAPALRVDQQLMQALRALSALIHLCHVHDGCCSAQKSPSCVLPLRCQHFVTYPQEGYKMFTPLDKNNEKKE